MDDRKKILPLLPCGTSSSSPHMVVPLFVGRTSPSPPSRRPSPRPADLPLLADRPSTNEPAEDEIHRIGTVSHVIQLLKLPDGTVKVLVEGRQRARILHYLRTTSTSRSASRRWLPRRSPAPPPRRWCATSFTSFESFAKLSKKVPQDLVTQAGTIDDPSRLADTVAASFPVKVSEKQAVLELESDEERLEKLLMLMGRRSRSSRSSGASRARQEGRWRRPSASST